MSNHQFLLRLCEESGRQRYTAIPSSARPHVLSFKSFFFVPTE
jgi:hypothetical protein